MFTNGDSTRLLMDGRFWRDIEMDKTASTRVEETSMLKEFSENLSATIPSISETGWPTPPKQSTPVLVRLSHSLERLSELSKISFFRRNVLKTTIPTAEKAEITVEDKKLVSDLNYIFEKIERSNSDVSLSGEEVQSPKRFAIFQGNCFLIL